ncbi:hypothetical protein M422DRAFT_259245 [Sphaerobolus stellatus SS14]|uniref:Uncharacterized protein n=1 Tax=Sphaerobolus stellatus (strain SS14) TaxID=990650 RepID=A0A0C9UT84_SPHS4|nr:hypothetical protein M422DRAFT_259245 [Sphaerobolus stellatus SS14]
MEFTECPDDAPGAFPPILRGLEEDPCSCPQGIHPLTFPSRLHPIPYQPPPHPAYYSVQPPPIPTHHLLRTLRWGYGRYEDAEERMRISPARRTIALAFLQWVWMEGQMLFRLSFYVALTDRHIQPQQPNRNSQSQCQQRPPNPPSLRVWEEVREWEEG